MPSMASWTAVSSLILKYEVSLAHDRVKKMAKDLLLRDLLFGPFVVVMLDADVVEFEASGSTRMNAPPIG